MKIKEDEMTDIRGVMKKPRILFIDEKGAALIMSLFLLVILTFIGLQSILTSSTEVILSANYKRSKEAFHAAEGATEYVVRDNQYFIVPPSSSGTINFPAGGVNLDTGDTSASGMVTFLTQGAPPVGSGTSMSSMNANYFAIDTTGTGSLGSQNRQRLQTAKIVPGA